MGRREQQRTSARRRAWRRAFVCRGPRRKRPRQSLTGPKVESRFKCGEAEFTEKRRVRYLFVRPPSPRGSQKEKSPPAGKRPGPDWGGRSPRRWWPRRRCHPMVRAARNVIAATPEEALDAAREVWKDREDVRSVEVWLDGAIVFQEDCEAAAPPVFSTATPAPQRSENGVGAKRRLWPALHAVLKYGAGQGPIVRH